MSTVRRYTEEEREFIRSYAFGHSHQEITDEFNRKFTPHICKRKIAAYLKNHGIKTGRTGQFEKGHVPHNKGVKGVCAYGSEKSWFKHGNMPVNHKPVGTESVRHNYKTGEKYVYVKVEEPNKWKMKHIIEWEKHNGPIPEGNLIIFLDGNTENTNIENLCMVTKREHSRMNLYKLRTEDKELTKTGVLIVKVIDSIGEAKRRNK